MSELCTHFSTLIISDLILFCSFILSHPLYFSYFIFFSPYLIKLISFLSPLFITTFLLFLAFFTGIVHDNFPTDFAQSRVTHLYTSVLEKLRTKSDYQNEAFQGLDDLGIYDILFGSSVMMEVKDNPVEFSEEKSEEDLLQASKSGLEKNPSPVSVLENPCAGMEEKRMENFLKILGEFEKMASSVEEKKKIEPSLGTKTDKVVEKSKAGALVRNGSEATGDRQNAATKVSVNIFKNGVKEYTPMVKAHSQRIISNVDHTDGDEKEHNLKVGSFRTWDHNNNLGSFGSMRKEKEWKRTLACKLFEERHNVDGGEGMDSLWEAYEMDSSKTMKHKNEIKKKNKKKSQIEFHEDYLGNEEEEEVDGGQLCCLQALKLSAGKMNLGMGRPNLVKITKAIKGFGWLHHVSKHSKKVHNNGDRY
ncbi:hypothetical protein DH2020_000570 [Rehmannia glutinosa]|uniref:Uncharacterized protein n=1 Tax=Rehmannia glutinosa TaxID=99300 RepID=A0ABR0XX65_REHGL